jgi:hypothetical protein
MSSSDAPITVRPPPPGYTIDLVHPEYIGYQLVIVAIVSASLSTFFLLLRLYTRKLIVKSLGWDDFWIVLAWVCCLLNLDGVGVTQLFGKYIFLFHFLTFGISYLQLHSQSETVSVSSIEYSLNPTAEVL